MSGIAITYLVCVIAGLAWALLNALFAGIFGMGDQGADGAGGDAGGGDAAAGHDHSVHLSPLSPTAIAIFVTCFGASGFVLEEYVKTGAYASIPIAFVIGAAVTAGMLALFAKIFSVTQQSSEPNAAELAGLVAQVLTPIPENGIGEIAYTARGSRFTAPARHVQGWAVPAHSAVVIERLVGNVVYVRRGD